MNFLLPADIEREFTDPAYWKEIFERNSIEWLGDYSKHSEIFKKCVKPEYSILQIGCENSTLADELYDNGFHNVLSIDTDSKVIAKAKKNSEKRPSLNYAVSSVTEIDPPNGQVDVVIDKGTLDAFLPLECSSQDVQLVDDMFEEITRCLAPLGRYIIITLAQQHIVAKLVEFFGTNDFMIRVQKNVLTEADFVMPVFVFIITKLKTAHKERMKFKFLNTNSQSESADNFEELFEKIKGQQKMDWFKHYISRGPVEETSVRIPSAASGEDRYELFIVDEPRVNSLCKYGVFIVPVGRERELTFATPRGRTILRRECELDRIIVVHLSRGQVYESISKIQDELDAVILDFMPKACSRKDINNLSLGAADMSKQIETGTSEISGKWSVEHVSVNESMYRRLVFLNGNSLTQSEVELKREKKDNWVVDWSKPLCDHHRHMLSALEYICDADGKVIDAEAAKGRELRLAVLGLGGGILAKVLHDNMFTSQIVGVELDAEMVAIARKHFHFPNSDNRLRVDICDAYEFLQNSAASPDTGKFEAIFVDLSGPVDEPSGLYCPPPQFVTEGALIMMRDSLTAGGVLTLNLVTRDDKIAEEVKKRSRAVFLSVICIKGVEDIYEVLICSGQPAKKFNRLLKKSKKGGGDECLVMKDEIVNQPKSAEDASKKKGRKGNKNNKKKNESQSGKAIAKNPSKLASTSSDEPATLQESLAVQEVGVHNKSESPCDKMKCRGIDMEMNDLKKKVEKMEKLFGKRISRLEKIVGPVQFRNVVDEIMRRKNTKGVHKYKIMSRNNTRGVHKYKIMSRNNTKGVQDYGGKEHIQKLKDLFSEYVHTSFPANAEGSCYLEQGGTKVLCAVFGPRGCRFRSRANEEAAIVVCQYSQATFSVPDRRNRPRGDRRGNSHSRLLERAFESIIFVNQFARSQIDIFFEVLEADGSNLAACVNAGSLALTDAGIPMRGLASAVECGSVDGVACADMSSREHNELVPRITLATVSGKEEVILVDMKNLIHKNHLPELLKVGIDACAQIHAVLETCVFNNVKAAHRLE